MWYYWIMRGKLHWVCWIPVVVVLRTTLARVLPVFGIVSIIDRYDAWSFFFKKVLTSVDLKLKMMTNQDKHVLGPFPLVFNMRWLPYQYCMYASLHHPSSVTRFWFLVSDFVSDVELFLYNYFKLFHVGENRRFTRQCSALLFPRCWSASLREWEGGLLINYFFYLL